MDKSHPSESLKSLNDLGHLSSAVGHHVINAFSAVVSNAEILRMRMAMTTPPDPSVLADMIITTAMDAASVARRLIDFTRPITSISDDRLRLDELISAYVEGRRQNGLEGVQWTTDLKPVPLIRGEAHHLREMFDRIIANCLEAQAGPSIEIGFTTMVDARGWVVLEIRDSGRGMEPHDLDRAVEPFFSTKPSHVGVGLTIANGIWRRHKGTLSLRSAPGEGTVLRLCVDPFTP